MAVNFSDLRQECTFGCVHQRPKAMAPRVWLGADSGWFHAVFWIMAATAISMWNT